MAEITMNFRSIQIGAWMGDVCAMYRGEEVKRLNCNNGRENLNLLRHSVLYSGYLEFSCQPYEGFYSTI